MKWMLLLISLFLITGCNEKNVVTKENNDKVDMESTVEGEAIVSAVESIHENNNDSNEMESSIKESVVSEVIEQPVPVAKEEVQVMQQVDLLDQEVTSLLAVEQSETVKEKVIAKFITLVDFIYYDAPIGDIYFKDLTAVAQEKVRSILNRMDGAIESKIPNYKDTLKEKYQKALQYMKEQANHFSNKVSEKLESAMGSENYQNFIDAKDDMKESFQNTAEIIKEETSKAYQNGKEKVSSWYQGLKEKYEK